MPNDKEAQDIQEIKTMLTALHIDIKRVLNQSGQIGNQEVLKGLQRDYSNVIIRQINEDINQTLEQKMTRPCEKRETCKTILGGFLQKNAALLKQNHIQESAISKKRFELQQIREANSPKIECATCFNQASCLFEKQVQLMQSLQIYESSADEKTSFSAINEVAVVTELLEPLSNIQRFQILKAVALETKTFSDFSQLTGLRGGNLLFHIQKLVDGGMILQRHERGDYMITEKGYKVLKGVVNAYLSLSASNH
ncbi:MAG: winged helix-turn-helix domain-containing protein [Candidatus Bathyarchaeia archaeon]|jgi:DNA-binding transcriptional ArsR family regulator